MTYCTNKELVFDYLKDQIMLRDRKEHLRLQAERLTGGAAIAERLLLRGLHFAVVDEVDSILVDEARTPLIISEQGEGNAQEQRMLAEALDLARELERDRHYKHDPERRTIKIADEGLLHLKERVEMLGPLWRGRIRREETVRLALSALYLFERDRHYLVRDGKVQIIDEFTGRVMADRSWERGLHQLIELKEGCEPTPPKETRAQISYQRFFRRYSHLSGMTGTAWEIRRELWSVYGLRVVAVPLNRPLRRKRLAGRMFRREQEKWRTALDRISRLHAEGRPVLVGTNSVAASERLGAMLAEAGLEHLVLNAKQDREEADIIALAGRPGNITVATSMAGRGTDIKLAPQVVASGGLHVMLTECQDAARIDRQLEGRCACQGDPGSFELLISLEDPLVKGRRGGMAARLARSNLTAMLGLSSAMGGWATRRAQRRLERIHRSMRGLLLKHDERQGDLLAFSGRRE